MSDYKMGNKYLVHRGFEDDGTDKGWTVGVYRGHVYELAGVRFNSNTYRFDIEVQEKRLPILVGEDQIKPFEEPLVFTPPTIYIPTPIVRDAIQSFGKLKGNYVLNTIINFMIVIGIAVMVIAWAILEAR